MKEKTVSIQQQVLPLQLSFTTEAVMTSGMIQIEEEELGKVLPGKKLIESLSTAVTATP